MKEDYTSGYSLEFKNSSEQIVQINDGLEVKITTSGTILNLDIDKSRIGTFLNLFTGGDLRFTYSFVLDGKYIARDISPSFIAAALMDMFEQITKKSKMEPVPSEAPETRKILVRVLGGDSDEDDDGATTPGEDFEGFDEDV